MIYHSITGTRSTNYFTYSFFRRYINDWNSLPPEVMSSPSLQSFKVSLIKYIRS